MGGRAQTGQLLIDGCGCEQGDSFVHGAEGTVLGAEVSHLDPAYEVASPPMSP